MAAESQTDRGNLDVAAHALNCDPATAPASRCRLGSLRWVYPKPRVGCGWWFRTRDSFSSLRRPSSCGEAGFDPADALSVVGAGADGAPKNLISGVHSGRNISQADHFATWPRIYFTIEASLPAITSRASAAICRTIPAAGMIS